MIPISVEMLMVGFEHYYKTVAANRKSKRCNTYRIILNVPDFYTIIITIIIVYISFKILLIFLHMYYVWHFEIRNSLKFTHSTIKQQVEKDVGHGYKLSKIRHM